MPKVKGNFGIPTIVYIFLSYEKTSNTSGQFHKNFKHRIYSYNNKLARFENTECSR